MAGALVRAVFCGAVDDGKSTLLGHLLASTGSVPIDDIALASNSGSLDYSLLTDGLQAEREQGITIDVAYRHLYLPGGGRVILADCPGHEQYTRNMAVAASLASVAVLVIDATRGVRRQSLRHASICALMGVRTLIVAVSKIDAVDNGRAVLEALETETRDRIDALGFDSVIWVPTSGTRGDNIVDSSSHTQWYAGPTLVEALARGGSRVNVDGLGARLPIQLVVKDSLDRWYAGRLGSGSLAVGDRVAVAGTTVAATIVALRAPSPTERAVAGSSVSVRLDHEIDVRRGYILVPAAEVVRRSRAHLADLVWLDPTPLAIADSYLLRCGPLEVPVHVDTVRHITDVETGEQRAGRTLEMNDIGRVEVVSDRPILLDAYADSDATGGFVLIDRATARTVAAGMVVHAIQRESEVLRHAFAVDRSVRESDNGIRGCVIWLTGLSGSGKSTIADALENRLHALGIRSYTLDGDTVRSTLSEDLGFSPEDRRENVRRVARVAELMLDAGLVVIVSLVSPYRADRELAKERFAGSDFFEVFVDTPLDVCRSRDPKGLYARSTADSSTQMTGIGQPYEAPEHADVRLDGTADTDESVAALMELLLPRRIGHGQ